MTKKTCDYSDTWKNIIVVAKSIGLDSSRIVVAKLKVGMDKIFSSARGCKAWQCEKVS